MGAINDKFCSTGLDKLLTPAESAWIKSTLAKFAGKDPTIAQMWKLLDEAWRLYNCDPLVLDGRISDFYRHPVWTLNGLHIECNQLSLKNREEILRWVLNIPHDRIADFGGGFGSLARMIGGECPDASVEVIEPFPSCAAQILVKDIKNTSYVEKLSGKYDVIIATDVFEHVQDPLAILIDSCRFLKNGGFYLIGNCFEPVIECHLPQNFHFLPTWGLILEALGLEQFCKINYTVSYRFHGMLNERKARDYEKASKRIYSMTRFLPRRVYKHLGPIFVRIYIAFYRRQILDKK
jgi:hypothetical protein